MKSILIDLAASLIFLAVLLATNDVAIATAVGIICGVLHIAWMLFRGQSVTALQWVGLALVITLGAATLITNNPLFVMIKPTMIQAAIAAALLRPGWLARYMSPAQLGRVTHEAVVRAGYIHPAGLSVMALVNLAVAWLASPAQWAVFHAVSVAPIFIVLAVCVWLCLRLTGRASAARAPAAPFSAD